MANPMTDIEDLWIEIDNKMMALKDLLDPEDKKKWEEANRLMDNGYKIMKKLKPRGVLSNVKNAARKVVEAFLKESIIWTDPKKTQRLKNRVTPRTEKHGPPTPADTDTENLIPGEPIEVFENGKWVTRPWKPSLKNKEVRLVEEKK